MNNNSNQTNPNPDDILASFTNLGGNDGLDADTMNLFGSFTNESMGGFGMDTDSSNVDLSSLQLTNLEDVQLAGTSTIGSQPVAISNENAAAQMMARLLDTSSQAQTTVQPPLPQAQIPTVTTQQLSTGQGKTNATARAGSESSDDMGDVPLAQLALMPSRNAGSGGGISNNLPQPDMTALLQNTGGTLQAIGAIPHLNAPGNNQQVTMAANMLNLGQPNNALMATSIGTSQQQQALIGNQLQNTETNQILNVAMGGPHIGTAPEGKIEADIMGGATKPNPNEPVNLNLKLEFPQPLATTDLSILEELEKIETQLCDLLGIGSQAIRMLTGPQGAEFLGIEMEVGSSKLKSTVKSFMSLVAEIQAAIKCQHRKLRDRGIPIHTNSRFKTDLAGYERELVVWTDAARLLASALDSGLKLSAESNIES